MADDARLAALSKELDAALARINAMQGAASAAKLRLTERASRHVARHGGRLAQAGLAGCVFAVAVGRLSLQQQHRAAEAAWSEERAALAAGRDAALADADALRAALRAEAEGGWAPVPRGRLLALLKGREEEGGKGGGGGGGAARPAPARPAMI